MAESHEPSCQFLQVAGVLVQRACQHARRKNAFTLRLPQSLQVVLELAEARAIPRKTLAAHLRCRKFWSETAEEKKHALSIAVLLLYRFYVYVHVYSICLPTRLPTYLHTYIHHILTHIHACMHACRHTYTIYTCMHTCIHTCGQTDIQTGRHKDRQTDSFRRWMPQSAVESLLGKLEQPRGPPREAPRLSSSCVISRICKLRRVLGEAKA